MVNDYTNFFIHVNNYTKISHVHSVLIKDSDINYTPEVTIVIPTYNRPQLLEEAINSALGQIDFDSFDILILDNNPERNDDTELLISTYNHSCISYYKNTQNIGMIGNWNRCFELAKGKWVVMLHDDDILYSNFLSESMAIIYSLDDFVGCLACRKNIFKSEDELFKNENEVIRKGVNRIYPFDNFSGFILGAPTGVIYNKDNVLALGGFNPDYFPTSDFCFMVMFNIYYPCYLNESTLLHYRIFDNESLKSSVQKQSMISDYYLMSQLMKLYSVPQCIFNIYFFYYSLYRQKEIVKSWDCNFSMNFLYSTINLKRYSKASFIVSRVFFKIIKLWVRKKKITLSA